MTATLRTFICAELSSEMQHKLDEMIKQLRRATPDRSVRWDKAEKIHLTLKFLGDTQQNDVPQIHAALVQATRDIKKFQITLNGVGCFPNLKQPRVVWVGINPSPSLMTLQRAVENNISPLGHPTEDRKFSPHFTLGRLRRETSSAEAASVGEAVRQRAAQAFGVESISHLILMKSDLQRSGSIYTALSSVELC